MGCSQYLLILKYAESLAFHELFPYLDLFTNIANQIVHLPFPSLLSLMCSMLESGGLSVGLLHMGRSQMQRDEALQCFKFGITPVLVATSLASRGLDFPDVTQVINYDMPSDMGEYARRLGRLGRVGQPGVATTLFTQADVAVAAPLVVALKAARQQVPEWLEDMAEVGAGVTSTRSDGAGASDNRDGDGGLEGVSKEGGLQSSSGGSIGVGGVGVSREMGRGGRSGSLLLVRRRQQQQPKFGAYLPSAGRVAGGLKAPGVRQEQQQVGKDGQEPLASR